MGRRFKSVLIPVLGRLVRATDRHPRRQWPNATAKILLLRYDRIGDMIMSTALLKAIASARRGVSIDVLASAANAGVLHANPRVGTVLQIDKRRPWTYLSAIWKIRRSRYDAVVDPMVLAPSLTSALLMWLSGAPHRIGIAKRGNEAVLTLAVDPLPDAIHCIDQSAALLAAFGVDMRRLVRKSGSAGWGIWSPEIFLTVSERLAGERTWLRMDAQRPESVGWRPRLVVNVSASSMERHWPPERFITTVLRLRSRFPHLLACVVGVPGDRARIERIAAEARIYPAFTSDYREMMAILAASDLALTPDTSVTHIASAFAKPAVVLFPAGAGPIFGPYGTAGVIIAAEGPTLESTPVEPVLATLESLIESMQMNGATRQQVGVRG